MARKETVEKSSTQKDVLSVVGKAVSMALSKVKPNGWNPNRMTPFMKESLRAGLKSDGWVASQALLIWGTNAEGKRQDVIIDGEHRWTVASELGFDKGPMVFLDGLTESQAKALTIKMNQKRGEFEEDGLAALIKSIHGDLLGENIALDLGIREEELMVMLAEPPVVLDMGEDAQPPKGPEGSTAGIPSSNVRMVQLFFNEETHGEFTEAVRRLATKLGTKTVTDTVLEAVRHASGAASNAA